MMLSNKTMMAILMMGVSAINIGSDGAGATTTGNWRTAIGIDGWRNLKKIGNRNFEHFGALRALAKRKMSPNYVSIEIRTPDFVPDFFFWDARIFQKKWCGLLLGLQNL